MSNSKIILSHLSQKDIQEILNWYEMEANEVAPRFLNQLADVLSRIERSPEIYPLYFDNVRRVLIPGFPYGIFYSITDRQPTVHGILHTARNPTVLKKRLV